MPDKGRNDPELRALMAQWERDRAESKVMFERVRQRFAALDARDRARRERLRRYTFGLLGRERAPI